MKNREVYVKDPAQNRLLNNGVASVTDAATAEERRTLRFELETFVCDGEYERGLERILRTQKRRRDFLMKIKSGTTTFALPTYDDLNDETRRALIGDRTGDAYVLGDAVEVRLVEAIPDAGALRFELLSEGRRLRGGERLRRGMGRRTGRPTTKKRIRRTRR